MWRRCAVSSLGSSRPDVNPCALKSPESRDPDLAKAVRPVALDAQQSIDVSAILSRTNVALMGPAGCGKSAVVQCVMTEGARRFGPDAVLVLSWTGAAAELVNGQTLASVLRTSVRDPSKESIPQRVMGDSQLLAELKCKRLVIIGEAPTIQGLWMNRLEHVLRRTAPTLVCKCWHFGGLTVLGKCRYGLFASRLCHNSSCDISLALVT